MTADSMGLLVKSPEKTETVRKKGQDDCSVCQSRLLKDFHVPLTLVISPTGNCNLCKARVFKGKAQHYLHQYTHTKGLKRCHLTTPSRPVWKEAIRQRSKLLILPNHIKREPIKPMHKESSMWLPERPFY